MPLAVSYVVPAGPTQAVLATAALAPFRTSLQVGHQKGKATAATAPFYLQNGWLKVAEQRKFIASHAKMAAVCPGRTAGCTVLAAPGWTPRPPPNPSEEERGFACIFSLLKYVIAEALPTTSVGLATCLFSEPPCNSLCQAWRKLLEASHTKKKNPFSAWHPPSTKKIKPGKTNTHAFMCQLNNS